MTSLNTNAYDDVPFLASLASEAYKDPSQRQSLFVHPLYGSVGLVANDQNFAMYQTNDAKHVYVSHRGTDLSQNDKRWQDLVNDFYIAIDRDEDLSRIHEADVALMRYNSSNTEITHVGHSLGGTIANQAAHRTNTNSVAFNPGSSPTHVALQSITLRHGYPVNWYTDHTVQHRIYNHADDFISRGAARGIYGDEQVDTLNNPTENPHALSNFRFL